MAVNSPPKSHMIAVGKEAARRSTQQTLAANDGHAPKVTPKHTFAKHERPQPCRWISTRGLRRAYVCCSPIQKGLQHGGNQYTCTSICCAMARDVAPLWSLGQQMPGRPFSPLPGPRHVKEVSCVTPAAGWALHPPSRRHGNSGKACGDEGHATAFRWQWYRSKAHGLFSNARTGLQGPSFKGPHYLIRALRRYGLATGGPRPDASLYPPVAGPAEAISSRSVARRRHGSVQGSRCTSHSPPQLCSTECAWVKIAPSDSCAGTLGQHTAGPPCTLRIQHPIACPSQVLYNVVLPLRACPNDASERPHKRRLGLDRNNGTLLRSPPSPAPRVTHRVKRHQHCET